MRVWILAGAISALGVPMASAATTECEAEESRRPVSQQRDEAATVSAPVERGALAERIPPAARAEAPRRRSGKGIPDAELIGVRGAL